ncbi:MAG: HAD family hydrolase [Candidatus Rokuibacteriota bacterium]
MTLVLFWDIDGTLLTTARAGIVAWEDAAGELVGRPVDFSRLETAGLTDVEIAARIPGIFGLEPTPERVEGLLRRYETQLPGRLRLRAGGVLPGVREIAEYLRGRPDICSLLLTGNTLAGARAKLAHYGLDGYFGAGAFCDGTVDRPSIARKALAMACDRIGLVPAPDRMYVIGDTPRDIDCARAIGARAVAVASGAYTVDDLRAHEPWLAIERLPEPEAFLQRLNA